jgi:hypothetical protein
VDFPTSRKLLQFPTVITTSRKQLDQYRSRNDLSLVFIDTETNCPTHFEIGVPTLLLTTRLNQLIEQPLQLLRTDSIKFNIDSFSAFHLKPDTLKTASQYLLACKPFSVRIPNSTVTTFNESISPVPLCHKKKQRLFRRTRCWLFGEKIQRMSAVF